MAAFKSVILATVAELILEEDDYENDNSVEDLCMMAIAATVERRDRIKIQEYVEVTVPQYDFDQFRCFFRLTRSTFEDLCQLLAHNPINHKNNPGGRTAIPLDKEVLITLWYVGCQEVIIRIADRFGVSPSTIIEARNRICKTLISLRAHMIKWPAINEHQYVIDKFENRKGFPKVLGAVDGTHIRVPGTFKNAQVYVNRKKFHSIQLQCVAREDMQFTHCYTGWPGSCHDARILRNSDLWDKGLEKCGDNHILGDSAYPVRKWLITPYRDNGHLTRIQRRFNFCLSSTRVIVEQAFGLFKGRFRRMKMLDVLNEATAVMIIIACCVLHNFCIINVDSIEEFLELDNDGDDEPAQDNVVEDDEAGAQKRDTIADNLAQ